MPLSFALSGGRMRKGGEKLSKYEHPRVASVVLRISMYPEEVIN